MALSDFIRSLFLRKTINIDKNRLTFFGIDYICYPARAMAITLQHIGGLHNEKFLFDLGYEAGSDAAEEMKKRLRLVPKQFPFKLESILYLLEIIGFGKPSVKIWKPKNGKMLLYVTNHPVIEWANRLYGRKSKVCAFFRGVYSAHAELELGVKKAHFIETPGHCLCHGKTECEWSTGIKSLAKTLKRR